MDNLIFSDWVDDLVRTNRREEEMKNADEQRNNLTKRRRER